MWTYTDDYNILPNLYVRSHFHDGTLSHYQVFPVDGYWLRITTSDTYELDEDGNVVLDENGNPVVIPYLSEGGATSKAEYNWSENPNGYIAQKK